MAWVTVAEGDLKAFEAGDESVITEVGRGQRVKHGAPFAITIESSALLGASYLYDLAGMEPLADMVWNKTHAHLRDVEGIGWNKIRLHMEANAFVIAPAMLYGVAAVVAAVLVGAGFVIATVKIESPEEALESVAKTAQWAGIAVVAVLTIGVLWYAAPMLKGLKI